MGIKMPRILFRVVLAITLLCLSFSVFALPTLGIGPFGPGVQDGSEPFNTDGNCADATSIAGAGDDCGESNNQVRTQDTITYNWSITANDFTAGQANPENVILEQILSPSVNAVVGFERIPAICTVAGGGGSNPISSISIEPNGDPKLTCNLGEFNEGAQLSFSVVVQASGESWNGTSFTSNQRVYSNADDGTPNAVTAVNPEIGPIAISSRPRSDLSTSGFRGYYLYGARDVGQGLENGYYTWVNMRVSTDQKTGTESIQQPFDFDFDLSATKQSEDGPDYTSSGFEYYMVDCAYNRYGYWGGEVFGKETYHSGYPINRKVIDSGTCGFSRDTPTNNSSPYKISIDNADLSGNRFPTEAGGNIDLSAGPYYYTNTVARFFIPMRVIDNEDGVMDGTGSIFIKNVLKNFKPVGVSGTLNFNGADEPGYNGNPMPDGTISNNIAPAYNYYLTTRGTWADYAFTKNNDAGTGYSYFVPSSSHSGQGLLAPTQAYVNTLHFGNNGSNDLNHPRTCLAFDNSTQKLVDRSKIGATAGTYAYVGTYNVGGFDHTNYIVEYGNVDNTGDDPISGGYNNQTGRYEGNWDVLGNVRCDDNITSWQTNPELVGSGIDDVNVIRVRLKDSVKDSIGLGSTQYIRFNAPLEIRQEFYKGPHDGDFIPVGTVAAGFGSVRTDEYWSGDWTPAPGSRPYTPSPETGNSDGDRVTIARTTSRLDSESLLPVAAPGTTTSTIAGKQIVWKLTTAIQSLLDDAPEEENVQIINELPPEVAYNQSCTATYTDDNGTVIGTPADLVEYNTDRDGNSAPGYTRLVWNLGTVTANDAITPRVICTDSDPLAPNGTSVMNYAEIRGDNLISALSVRSDTHTITLEQVGSIQTSKIVDSTLDDVNDTQNYTLSWANFAASFAIDPPTIIDVFPFNGDDGPNSQRTPKTEMTGTLVLTAPPVTTWIGGETDGAPLGTWYYSTDDPSTINFDPDNNFDPATGIPTNWVLEAALGGDFSQVTAIKFVSAYKLEKDGDPHQGMKATYSLKAGDSSDPLSNEANLPGNIYSNLFTLDTDSLPAEQFLKSNTVTVQVASYFVGDLVFADIDGDLKYTSGVDIPAPDGITVELRKQSDSALVDTTTTGIVGRGRYLFEDVGSGEYYVQIPASQFADNATLDNWDSLVTSAGLDDDINENLDQNGYKTAAILSSGVRTNSFLLSATPPLPGGVPKGDEPLGDNTASLAISVGDDFSNLTQDIALKPALDFGDAPDSYGDAGHGVSLNTSVFLGNIAPDTETQPQNTANGGTDGTGDNGNEKLDEDGTPLVETIDPTDTRFQSNVTARNNSAIEGLLVAWLDFDNSGTFEASEAQSVVVPAGFNGTLPLLWDNIPAGTIQPGKLWLRIRISTDTNLSADNATGPLFDGEVEDYEMTVVDGVSVSGRVFIDTNSDGVNDASEAGILKHTIVLHDDLFNTCRSTYTDSNGDYRFSSVPAGDHQLYQADGETVPTPQTCNPALAKNPANYTSTTVDSLSFLVANTDITDQDFGETKAPVFQPDHQSQVSPGSVAFYAHTFSSPVAGSVQFSTSSDLATSSSWSHLLYRDDNCDGTLSSLEATPLLENTDILINSGNQICIVTKVFSPANLVQDEQYRVITSANFNYAGGLANNVSLTVTDLTTTSPFNVDSNLTLTKSVENKSQGTPETENLNQGKPGDILIYRIRYQNIGTGPITNLEVNDSVPAFTGYVTNSAICGTTPSTLTCNPHANGDDLRWSFTGLLNGGSSGSVSYEVLIDQ
jgi:uncharacterized repeat protein (TIGR01451 family)